MSDVQETLSEDAMFRVVAKKQNGRNHSGVERHTLIASFVRDLIEHLVFAYSACVCNGQNEVVPFYGDRSDQVR